MNGGDNPPLNAEKILAEINSHSYEELSRWVKEALESVPSKRRDAMSTAFQTLE